MPKKPTKKFKIKLRQILTRVLKKLLHSLKFEINVYNVEIYIILIDVFSSIHLTSFTNFEVLIFYVLHKYLLFKFMTSYKFKIQIYIH